MSTQRRQSGPGGGYLHKRPGGREGEFDRYQGPMGRDAAQRGSSEGQGGRRDREGEDARRERGEE